MTPKPKLLIVDDDQDLVELFVDRLRDDGYDAEGETDPKRALDRVGLGDLDLVVTDVEMPGLRGIDLLRAIQAKVPGQLVLLMTGFGTIDLAVRALREGACDFLTKPFEHPVLKQAVERALRERAMRREIVRLRAWRAEDEPEAGTLVARSEAMRRVVELGRRVARTDSAVLLRGESGVGKTALARFVHDQGARRRGPFVAVNCAAIPATLFESELFGVEKGAFTDAKERRVGLVAQATGGTLLLDEVGELPLELQAKLLQVLESGEVRPVGATRGVPVDVRVIAATNADLEALVKEGRFRRDLYFRLNVVGIEIPALRQRRDDLLPLVDDLLARICRRVGREVMGVSADALRWIETRPWPGNVRELANTLERAVVLADHDTLVREDFEEPAREEATAEGAVDALLDAGWTLARIEAASIERALERHEGNKTEAARQLGIDRRTVYRHLDREGDGEG
jgi:DNA-binding NtrC family response regulator